MKNYMEESIIKDIVFTPQSHSLLAIKEFATDSQNRKQLASVFGCELLNEMLNSNCESTIPNGGLYKTKQDSNLVVFWGMPNSGRTSAIFSVLTQKGFRIHLPHNQSLSDRIEQICTVFKSKKAVFMPDLSKDDVSEIYHATYKSWLLGRSYNISFFKPQKGPNTNIHILDILNRHHEQIHVFCIDCGKYDKGTSYLEEQVNYHERVIKYLDNHGFLKQCNAIYLLVTKSDLMNVPDIYEENAAQTFVTSGTPDFWHKIENICYDKNIYDVQPIVFSIGNFILKDFARIDADYGKLFLEESILPKCQPKPNYIEKILSMGKAKHTPKLIFIVLLLVAIGIFWVWNAIVPPPEQKVVAFDYAKTFMEQEKGLKGLAYEKGTILYQTLRDDLKTESSLHQPQGGMVLPDSTIHQCDSILTNDYSTILNKELERLFASKKWTADEHFLRKIDTQVTELTSHASLKATAIKDYHDYINNFFYYIKPLLQKSTKCYSVQEARLTSSKALQWKKHPYNKDTQLNRKLSEVKGNAYKSCADHYRNIANNRIKDYNAQVRKLNTSIYSYLTPNQRITLRRKFQAQNATLIQNISLLISDLKSTSDSRLVSIRKSLEQTKAALVNIYQQKEYL